MPVSVHVHERPLGSEKSTEQKRASQLQGDPAREAVDAIRGYVFQVLRSVLAWIDLGEDEILYLEGAEDFDRVTAEKAEANQIKDTAKSGSLTLRSKSAAEAIGNFWKHKPKNRDRRVTYRYLTTSSAGQEREGSFKTGVGGIALWQSTQSEKDPSVRTDNIQKIAEFLCSDTRLPADLREFLSKATASQIFDELIEPFSWETDAAPIPGVIDIINDKLVTFGSGKGVAAADSEAVLAALHSEAWLVATRDKDRALSKADFIRIFDQNTTISVPKAELAALTGIISKLLGSAALVPAPSLVQVAPALVGPPPLPPRHFDRDLLSAALGPVIVLQGATGTGKTTAAASFARKSPDHWFWVDLRGKSAKAVGETLRRARSELIGVSGNPSVVLDDLGPSGDHRDYEADIAKLAEAIRDRGAKLLITSVSDLPPRIGQVIGLAGDQVIRVPSFTVEEIARFLAERGCSAPLIESWSKLIRLTSLGHAQLVHARIAALEALEFPPPSAKDLLETPADVADVRTEARRLLSELPSGPRMLAFRISALSAIVDRSRLMAIAESPPPISEPGNAIDQLIGPWIEIIQPGIYRVSPIIMSAGEQVLGKGWSIENHRLLAWSLLRSQTLTPMDISEILTHAVVAEDYAAVARLSLGLLHQSGRIWRSIADAASWFPAVLTSADGPQLPGDKPFKLLVRLFQFRIAVYSNDRDSVDKIISRFEHEFPRADEEQSNRVFRLLFLMILLAQLEVHQPLEKVMQWLTEYYQLTDALADLLHRSEPSALRGAGLEAPPDYAQLGAFALPPRIERVEHLEVVLDSLESMPVDAMKRVASHWGSDESSSRAILDRVWLTHFHLPTNDWERVLRAVYRCYDFGRQAALVGLARAAAKVVVRMTDEEFGRPQDALEEARRFGMELGDFPALKDAEARVLARQDKHEMAVRIWALALPQWQVGGGDLAPSHSYRDAAISAARLDDWALASEFLEEGARRCDEPLQAAYKTGMLIDAGFAAWKATDNQSALRLLADGVSELEVMQANTDAEPLFSVQKRAGHTLMWIAARSRGDNPSGFSAPPPACCSNLDPIPDPRPRQTNLDFIISHLLQIEETFGSARELYRKYDKRMRATPFALLRVNHADLGFRQRVRNADFDDLVDTIADLVETTVIAQKYHRDSGRAPTELLPDNIKAELGEGHLSLVGYLIVIAVFALAARGQIDRLPLQQWQEQANRRNLSSVVAPLADISHSLFIADTGDPMSLVQSNDQYVQLLASLKIALADDTPPQHLLRCHGLWALHFGRTAYRQLMASDVLDIITAGWNRMMSRPFLLTAPRSSIPELKAAMEGAPAEWRTIKAILQAALAAAPLQAADPARRAIDAL